MLGMVFTEFVEMVETHFSPEVADAILQQAAPADGGAYTAVGYYDHAELVAMVAALSERTGIAVPDLVRVFGKHLLGRFTELYPGMFSRCGSLFDFLASIDAHIHVEVRKLYGEARLPHFDVLERSPTYLRLRYRSPRSMEALALGLLEGAAEHYGQASEISAHPEEGGDGTVFLIRLVGG